MKFFSYKYISSKIYRRVSLLLPARVLLFFVLISLLLIRTDSVSRPLFAFQTGQTLQGSVLNENDQVQAGATVSIFLEGVFVQSLLTLADGQFTVNLPRPGQYNVLISQDGFRPHNEIMTVNK